MQIHFDSSSERINPKVFEQCFRRWIESIVEVVGAPVIPIDGKTIQGSYDREQGKSALHLVSAPGESISSCFRTSIGSR